MRSTRAWRANSSEKPFSSARRLGVATQDDRPRVGDGVDGVSHAVDEAGLVECFPIEHAMQVVRYLLVVLPVGEGRAEVVEHPDDFEVRATMPRALERAE